MKVKRMRETWRVTGGLVALLLVSSSVDAGPVKVYIADEDSDTISVIETTNLKRVAVVPVGKSPHDIRVSPDGRLGWVTHEWDRRQVGRLEHQEESERERGWISAVDTGTDQIVAKVLVGRRPAHVGLGRDGRFAYVTNSGESTVSVVDTSQRRVVATVPVGAYPHGIRVHPTGSRAYVANLKGGTVSVIDIDAWTEVTQIPVGKGPTEIECTPDGRLVFVSLRDENAVAVINPSERTVIRKIAVGPVPAQVTLTPDSRFLLVANHGTRKMPGGVSIIDLATLTVSGTLEVGAGVHGVAVSEDGRFAYVTNSHADSLSVIDLGELRVIAVVPAGRGPHGVSVKP